MPDHLPPANLWVDALDRADADVAAGRTSDLLEVLAELDAEDARSHNTPAGKAAATPR